MSQVSVIKSQTLLDYPRRPDVLEQLRHARPDVSVHDCLQATVREAASLLRANPTARP
ncbi:hypothetical protein [Streptomyces sp. NBC_01538]|uniref:hypothetical protein n=1 Tax=Streptomyces sp. NBC_01538 TaxID=2903897 RepID=UPI003870E103